jgi:biopolymer transport protein ExbD
VFLDKDRIEMADLQAQLAGLRFQDTNVNVVVRGSARTKYQHIVQVMDALQLANVGKVNLATEAFPDPSARKE